MRKRIGKEAIIVGKTRDACEHMNSVGTFFLFVGVILLIVEVILLASDKVLILSSMEMESVFLIVAGAGMRGYAGIKLAEIEDCADRKSKGRKPVTVQPHPDEPMSAEKTEEETRDMFFEDDDDAYIPDAPISDEDPYADVKRLLKKQAQGNFYRRR